MKIVLHSEARTISNAELVKNERDLIAFLKKIIPFKWLKSKFSSKYSL